jgi:uncharacterized membrane protein YebE (DUF533 family)
MEFSFSELVVQPVLQLVAGNSSSSSSSSGRSSKGASLQYITAGYLPSWILAQRH